MHGTLFIQDLTIAILTAAFVSILFRRLHQPVVLGYLMAGLIIGPHTPPFALIHDLDNIKTLADLGIILLMFSLGLHFNLKKVREVGGTAVIAALLEILFMIWIGFEVGNFFGWVEIDCIFLGAILAISSTTIIVKALQDLGKSHTEFAKLIFGILIVEDILAVALLALLSGIAMTGELKLSEVGATLGRLGIFLTVVLVLGLLVVPRFLHYVAKFKSKEMMLVTCLGLCFGVSWLAIKLGYSEALGAFLIGAVIAESKEIHEIEQIVEPVRDLFSAIFFISVGLLIEPQLLVQYALPITVITLAVIVGKVVTCSFGTYVAGNDYKTSFKVGMGLAQIGEFSFIIASLGLSLKVTSGFLYPIAVTVSSITTLLTPYLIRASDGFLQRFATLTPKGVVASLNLYTLWVRNLAHRGASDLRRGMQRGFLQILLNLAFVSGIFIVADRICEWYRGTWNFFPIRWGGLDTVCWSVAMLLSFPFLLASFRKLFRMGAHLADASTVSGKIQGKRLKLIRALISNTFLMTGIVAVGLWILILSSTLFLQGEVVAGLVIFLGLMGVVFWNSFLRIYSRAQAALTETLSEKS
ncbi:MAG: cation:proton antiporter [bacterium]